MDFDNSVVQVVPEVIQRFEGTMLAVALGLGHPVLK